MKNYLSKASKLMILYFILSLVCLIAQTNSRITGVITDAEIKEPLFGANISLIGKSIGAASDVNGRYLIANVAPGDYTVRVSYLGYQSQETKITIAANRTLELNFQLVFEEVMGEAVIVTTQREGQLAAINQQLQSDAIKNVVSSEKIRELPEANAAEAVGRLSGVSLLRSGGEGNKVVIRGLAPQYNKVQIDGVDMASTSSYDRSSDLSMISPFMLSGIEVTKSALADQEANQLGGTVNFVLKGAPYGKPHTQFIVEGGYNGLRRSYNDYKIVGQHNRRLFNDLIGFSINTDVEKRNRSSNSIGAGYSFLNKDSVAVPNSFRVSDVTRELNRYGGSIILDYKTTLTDIKLSNMVSRIDRNTVNRNENVAGIFEGLQSRSQNISQTQSNTTIFVSKLALEQYIGTFKLDFGGSFAFSEDKAPEILSYGGSEALRWLDKRPDYKINPEDLQSYLRTEVDLNSILQQIDISDYYTKEKEYSTYLDITNEFTISNDISIKLKAGAKYKNKTKMYDSNNLFFPIQWTKETANQEILKKFPWMTPYYKGGLFPYFPFVDNEYDPGDFMRGKFKLARIPSLELGKEMIYHLRDVLGVDYKGSTTPLTFTPNFHSSIRNDYIGEEEYFGAYFMPTIKVGKIITFIPGFRYESNKTEYSGIRANGDIIATVSAGLKYHDTTSVNKDNFILPMIHLRVKPFEGFDIRASFTQTLSRPSYNYLIPSWYFYQSYIDYHNPNIKPSKSTNYDIYVSLYGNKIGLFTLGYFEKRIDDLIFWQNKKIVSAQMAEEEFGFSEQNTYKHPRSFIGQDLGYYINNPNEVKVSGVEVEWQTNFWFLPGLLQNIVFSINYTYTKSEALYPKTIPVYEWVQKPFGKVRELVGNEDDSYYSPLLLQPDHILNITLGYDYKDFSIRTSMQYKSDIFSTNNYRYELRGMTDPLYLYDLSVSQKLPIDGLSIYGNIKNISKTIEGNSNLGTGYLTSREYYGMTAGFGVKYQF